jgi:predicted alpha/beta superfamily hydrolase
MNFFPAVETHLLSSKHVLQTYKIQVMRPMQRRGDTRRFPVVYATDGNAVFDVFKGLGWIMQAFSPHAPAFILVTVGYPEDSPVAGEILRARDLTFPGCPDWVSGREVAWEGVLRPQAGTKSMHGARQFQDFLADELIPFIDARYETDPQQRLYFGHSMGGSFGLFTLFTRSSLFHKYLISSPALLYDGTTAAGVHHERSEFLFEHAKTFLATHTSLQNIDLYLSVGTQEQFEPLVENWQFTSSFYRLVALMRRAALPGLRLTTEVFAGEGHATVWPIAFMHGVQAVLKI